MIYLVDTGQNLGLRRVLAISDTGENLGGHQAGTLAAAEAAIKARLGSHEYRSVSADDPELLAACKPDGTAVLARNEELAAAAAARARKPIA